jgi:hypothetical protein
MQQRQLVGTFSDNEPLPTLEARIVVKIANEKIIGIDEYFDRSSSAERLEAFREKTSLQEARELCRIVSGHHVEVGFRGM